uniref:Uncharacterized protein n=1 Tax=Romanomermis culicivorax TaxID=13658 RepID=A0A915JNF5_ROMCU
RTHIARCTKCKRRRSLKNGGNLYGGHGDGTFFARRDALGPPSMKISTNKVLMIVWAWANEISVKTARQIFHDYIGEMDVILIDWYNYICEILINQLQNAAQMGGQGETVQID